MLLPALGKARDKARATQCISNWKQIGLAVQLYTQDNDDFLFLNSDAQSFPYLPYGQDSSAITYQTHPFVKPLLPYVGLDKAKKPINGNTIFVCPALRSNYRNGSGDNRWPSYNNYSHPVDAIKNKGVSMPFGKAKFEGDVFKGFSVSEGGTEYRSKKLTIIAGYCGASRLGLMGDKMKDVCDDQNGFTGVSHPNKTWGGCYGDGSARLGGDVHKLADELNNGTIADKVRAYLWYQVKN